MIKIPLSKILMVVYVFSVGASIVVYKLNLENWKGLLALIVQDILLFVFWGVLSIIAAINRPDIFVDEKYAAIVSIGRRIWWFILGCILLIVGFYALWNSLKALRDAFPF